MIARLSMIDIVDICLIHCAFMLLTYWCLFDGIVGCSYIWIACIILLTPLWVEIWQTCHEFGMVEMMAPTWVGICHTHNALRWYEPITWGNLSNFPWYESIWGTWYSREFIKFAICKTNVTNPSCEGIWRILHGMDWWDKPILKGNMIDPLWCG